MLFIILCKDTTIWEQYQRKTDFFRQSAENSILGWCSYILTNMALYIIERACLVYNLNVLIKSKRPALVRCSNGKRGGFCCCKDTNNHWQYKLFSKKNHSKVDSLTYLYLIMPNLIIESRFVSGEKFLKISLCFLSLSYSLAPNLRIVWSSYI